MSAQIPQFRGPQTVGPVPSAVGVSIAIDKITTAVSSMEDPVSLSSCFTFFIIIPEISVIPYEAKDGQEILTV